MENSKEPICILCGRDDNDQPLLKLSYKGQEYYTCAEHMPMLIHKPDSLVGKLPGAENMNAG